MRELRCGNITRAIQRRVLIFCMVLSLKSAEFLVCFFFKNVESNMAIAQNILV
jgi:hypothetical protein